MSRKITGAYAKAIGSVLRDTRKSAGLSQEALGLECGIAKVLISRMERGTALPSIHTLYRIAKVLGVPTWELVKEAEMRLEVVETGEKAPASFVLAAAERVKCSK